MSEIKKNPEVKAAELNDEELEKVDGGLFISGESFKCSKCGKLFGYMAERDKHQKNCNG